MYFLSKSKLINSRIKLNNILKNLRNSNKSDNFMLDILWVNLSQCTRKTLLISENLLVRLQIILL